jgi:hypothetical protein
MDDKADMFSREDHGGEGGSSIFPETEMRRVAERFVPRPVLMQDRHLDAIKAADATRAIEEALRRPPAPEPRHPLLAAREHTHGDFESTALIAQRFKDVARNTPNWGARLTDVQREALEGVFTKIARILSGDPNHKDHWSDVAGGAHLVEERL